MTTFDPLPDEKGFEEVEVDELQVGELEVESTGDRDRITTISETEYEILLGDKNITTTVVNIDPCDEITGLLGKWGLLELLEHFKSKLKLCN